MRAPLIPQALIFDLDGTLLDSLGDLADAVNHILAERGFPRHPEDAYRFFVGNGMRMLVRRAAPASLAEAEIPALAEAVEAYYAEIWHRRTRPYPGVAEALKALREKGFPVGVLSNKPHGFTRLMVEHFFPGLDFFDVRGQVPGVPAKPDPTSALDMAGRLGVAPERVCFVGDSRVDMETAVNAAMFPVGVTWGFRPRAELLEFGAGLLVDRAEDLPGL